ncbi:MAG: prolyl oligopeptidase family serine peptidase [Candidatus Latescibacteria bacterium]|nr:prolyl oligopeptidase family serine peptidase [Candidatus Latescibacterota bacterium]
MARSPSLLQFLAGILLVACGSEDPLAPDDTVARLDALLAEPTTSEIAAALSELDAKSPVCDAGGLQVLEQSQQGFADLSLVSYRSGGLRIYGVIARPKAPGRYPLLLYNHGGDGGIDPTELDHPLAGGFVQVASSFRDEAVHWFGTDYRSDGPASPWDRDVDDALVLLECARGLPEADTTRTVVLGGSRGGGVSLLAAARRPDRFRCAIDIYGPTDFLDPAFRGIADTLAAGGSDSRPGMDFLKSTLLTPYLEGTVPLATARAALIRRSSIYFAGRLPPTQVHHGTMDLVVPITQSDRLAARLEDLGKPFEYYRYPGAGHEFPLGPDQIPRMLAFISKHLQP